ncbi:helix-turn-helix transcriptional regulator [Nonomuraea sp. NPDC000554]|uniref:helix-turn-helix transcriptional regulator n=1 Tax=Nonomuraea sp. NPDC000554 TaxID=3154259 RepID=UPI00332067C0
MGAPDVHTLTRDLGDQRAACAALTRAPDLAEPERLIVSLRDGAWLLETMPAARTSHGALINDILDAVEHGNPAAPPTAEELSSGELRVFRYLPTHLTRPEIAGELSVSLNTVNTHIRRIYAKLGATDRSAGGATSVFNR